MKILIAIPAHNRCQTTISCLKQLSSYFAGFDYYTFLVIDDGSIDGTSEEINKLFPSVVVLEGDGNLWWTGAVEKGRAYAVEHNFTHLIIVNDDLEFDSNFISPLIEASKEYPNALIGAVKISALDRKTILVSGYLVTGACLQFADPYSGDSVTNLKENLKKVDALAGATLLIPVHVARAVGPFNVKDFPHNFGDFEYTYRASQLGYPCYTASRSRIYTVPNPDYLRTHLYTTTRMQFIKNLFDRHKLAYGFVPTYKRALMGKKKFVGLYCLLRAYASLGLKILYKLFIWNTAFDAKRKTNSVRNEP